MTDLYHRAVEYVHHLPDCPAIGGNGDNDCSCGAVELLDDLRLGLDVANQRLRATMATAYGQLWREHKSSEQSRAARRTLREALTVQERKVGIDKAIQEFGPTTTAEILRMGLQEGRGQP